MPPHHSSLKIETAIFFETLVPTYQPYYMVSQLGRRQHTLPLMLSPTQSRVRQANYVAW